MKKVLAGILILICAASTSAAELTNNADIMCCNGIADMREGGHGLTPDGHNPQDLFFPVHICRNDDSIEIVGNEFRTRTKFNAADGCGISSNAEEVRQAIQGLRERGCDFIANEIPECN